MTRERSAGTEGRRGVPETQRGNNVRSRFDVARLRAVLKAATGHTRILGGLGAGLRFSLGCATAAYVNGEHELPVQHALGLHAATGGVLYDIGANVGFLTLIGASLVGPTGAVYAFEPVPENAASIARNARLNDYAYVNVLRYGVSDRAGRSRLHLAEHPGGAVLATAGRPPDLKGTIEVEVVTIDEVVATGGLRPPTVVKLDVEGAELHVLRGMIGTLERYRPVVVYEIDDMVVTNFDSKCAACEGFLAEHGYDVSRLADSYPSARSIIGHFVAVPAR